MPFAILTLFSALSLASISAWFSIIGISTIFSGAQIASVIMGIVIECGKLVTTSWLYRNWKFSNWKIKIPLIFFTIIIMLATSMGCYGFLAKAHLSQNSSTVDNSAKIERLNQQISREKEVIVDDEKVINQLDTTVNSYIGKDKLDKSVTIRKNQTLQRTQLRSDIDSAQKRIDGITDEKFKLESELRKLQLDVGPIKYVSELIYGENGNVESAVKIFILLIIVTLDPLAVVLLIAANHTLLRLQKLKSEDKPTVDQTTTPEVEVKEESCVAYHDDTDKPSIINNNQRIFGWIKEFKNDK